MIFTFCSPFRFQRQTKNGQAGTRKIYAVRSVSEKNIFKWPIICSGWWKCYMFLQEMLQNSLLQIKDALTALDQDNVEILVLKEKSCDRKDKWWICVSSTAAADLSEELCNDGPVICGWRGKEWLSLPVGGVVKCSLCGVTCLTSCSTTVVRSYAWPQWRQDT